MAIRKIRSSSGTVIRFNTGAAARRLLFMAIAAGCLLPQLTRADTAAERKRALLAHVKVIAIVPSFFGTDTLGELPPAKMGAHARTEPGAKEDPERKSQAAQYRRYLAELEKHAAEAVPARFAARTPFTVLPQAATLKALSALKLTAPELFQAGGRISSKRFDLPDAGRLQQLAGALHADAILVGVLDEPQRDSGHYYFDPLMGPGYDSPAVHDKATFDLVLADGTTVLRHTLEVEHPATKVGQRTFVLADWIETEDLLIEDLMDEVTRYTPKKSPQVGAGAAASGGGNNKRAWLSTL